MTAIKSDSNPDKRGRAKPDNYLENWIERQSLVESMIPIIGKFHREKNVRILLYGIPLISLSVIEIMQTHRTVREVEENELSEYESSMILASLDKLDLGPSQIDIGILAAAFMFDDHGQNLDQFVEEQVKKAVGNHQPVLKKPQDVVLFGFGRIGRLITRLILEDTGAGETFSLKAVVVRKSKSEDLLKRAELMRRDSVHGPFKGTIRVDEESSTLIMNGNPVKFIYSNDPEEIDYSKFDIKDAILIDNTGVARDEKGLSKHLKSKGISKVLLTAPTKGRLKNIVYGVNHKDISDKDLILGAASCTTNAIVPLLKAISEEYGIDNGHVETVHSYTNDQNLIDNYHDKARRGRSAALNMVLTETGAANAVSQVLPELDGKLSANAIRVPTPNVSMAILNLHLEKETKVDELNNFLRQTAFHSIYKDQIDYTNSPEIVSSDIIGSRFGCVVDSQATICNRKNIVIYAWYDNEFGYTKQVIRLAKYISKVRRLHYY